MQREHEHGGEPEQEQRIHRRDDPETLRDLPQTAAPQGEHDEQDRSGDPEQGVALHQPATADELDHQDQEEDRSDDRDDLGSKPEVARRGGHPDGCFRESAHEGPPAVWASALPVVGSASPSPSSSSTSISGLSIGSGRRRSSPTKSASMTLTM